VEETGVPGENHLNVATTSFISNILVKIEGYSIAEINKLNYLIFLRPLIPEQDSLK
jgi:hypothetical protein